MLHELLLLFLLYYEIRTECSSELLGVKWVPLNLGNVCNTWCQIQVGSRIAIHLPSFCPV